MISQAAHAADFFGSLTAVGLHGCGDHVVFSSLLAAHNDESKWVKHSIYHHLVQLEGVKATIWPPAGQMLSLLPQQPAGSLCWIPRGASEGQTSLSLSLSLKPTDADSCHLRSVEKLPVPLTFMPPYVLFPTVAPRVKNND